MLSFRVAREEQGDVVVELHGELAHSDWTAALRDYLERHYISDGVQRIRLDLAGVSALDLDGLATLVVLQQEARRNTKAFLVEGLRGQPLEKMTQTGMIGLLTDG